MEATTQTWFMFTVYLTLNNGNKTRYISSVTEKEETKAIESCKNNLWESGIKTIDEIIWQ